MLAETGMLAAIAAIIAMVAFIVKTLNYENETGFKALNFLAAIVFGIVFFFESASLAMYAAIVWAIIALLFLLFGQRNEAPLKGWNEELWQRQKAKPKRKRKPKEKKPEDGTSSGSGESNTPLWPWG